MERLVLEIALEVACSSSPSSAKTPRTRRVVQCGAFSRTPANKLLLPYVVRLPTVYQLAVPSEMIRR